MSLSENSVAGGKTILAASDPGELPASSFYRVEFDCPVKPDSAKIDFSGGYPSSDVIFSSPGYYECEAELGVVTKSSCAGVQYSPLLKKSFKITVAPSGEK
ncbi:MAG: hypothetical protein K2H64_01970 [Desulfovibrio sp.]|nr:hypothetical protein [Desulfovibrio sp.]